MNTTFGSIWDRIKLLPFALSIAWFPQCINGQVKPTYNVLMICVHDMNERVSFLGNTESPTPNFDRLVAHGMVFRRNYCQYPLCSPSRTSLLSGWRPDKTKIYNNEVRPRTVMGDTVKFLPEYFHLYGYRTERYGIVMQAIYENDIQWDYAEPPEATKFSADTNLFPGGSWWINNLPDSLTTDGVEALHLVTRLKQPQTQLFFYALGFGVTHSPFTPNLIHWNKVGDPAVKDHLPDKNGDTTHFTGTGSSNILIPNTPPGDRLDIPEVAFFQPPILQTGYEWQKTIHAYDGEVSQLDAYLGLVLDELDRQNLWKNTVVVFWSDHGQHLGEHEGTWNKLTLFEESVHVPLIICVPGKRPGVCDQLTEHEDVYATLAELCGLPKPPGMQGTSLVPLLDNPAFPWKRAVFTQVRRSYIGLMGRNIRTSRYSYNSWDTAGEELYDHSIDPHEYTNQITNPAYTTVLQELRAMLDAGWTASLPPQYPLLTFYRDADKDGYGNAHDSVKAYAAPPGYVASKTDCNDNNASIHPGAKEDICNGIDDNCDSRIDEGKPVPRITPLGSLDICAAGYVQLQTNAGVGYYYQWKRNGANIAGATKRTYMATAVGTYTVLISLSNGCSSLSKGTKVTSSCTAWSMGQQSSAVTSGGSLTVYPNPAKDAMMIIYNSPAMEQIQLSLVDITGKTLYRTSFIAYKGMNRYPINVIPYAAGLYYIEVTASQKKEMLKIIIEK